ncbi:EAP30/Vps36 family-domain-containing protein [Zopfochytrium polystomum]|nr:EAP30/Vps36 family-domain-containing protein [Zopfochytrium polystomum]
MRRRGIQGLQQQAQAKDRFNRVGAELQAQQLSALQSQLETFRTHLTRFATEHRKDILRDPAFRLHFQRMCDSIGVDPLASNKGFWASVLGVGDFYYDLAVQIAEACLATRPTNGGVMPMEDLRRMLARSGREASEDDIERSVRALEGLGGGFQVVGLAGRKMVVSVPKELDEGLGVVLAAAEARGGFVTVQGLVEQHGWESERALTVLMRLLQDGICWIDEQASPEPDQYWVVSFFNLAS